VEDVTQRTVEAVWRIESARLIAGVARTDGDVGLAEDLAQDALVAALDQWPSSGVPDNPGAWLTAVARRRYVDGVRRQITFERKVDEIRRDLRETENPMDEIEFDEHVEDDVLRLIFTACHPVLSREARVALTLKMVGGLSTEQIARAFLVSTPTVAARITRAKKALSDAGVPFEVPLGAELAAHPVGQQLGRGSSPSEWRRPTNRSGRRRRHSRRRCRPQARSPRTTAGTS
jgi:RNA polymerase sigma factor (sigma-70 family)